MSYRVITSDNTTINASITLGNAFRALDDWCRENKGVYGLGNIYHEFDNQVGIDVYLKDGTLKQFSIIYK